MPEFSANTEKMGIFTSSLKILDTELGPSIIESNGYFIDISRLPDRCTMKPCLDKYYVQFPLISAIRVGIRFHEHRLAQNKITPNGRLIETHKIKRSNDKHRRITLYAE